MRSQTLKEARYELVEVPEAFGPVEVCVDEAKVLTYAFAQGDFGSWYFQDSPFGGPVAHPLALANDLLFLFYAGYDGNTAQGLHTHETLRFRAPVRVGEKVTVTGAYTDKYERRGQGYVVLEAEARGEDGRVLVEHVGKEIMRTVAGDVAGRGATTANERNRSVRGQADLSLPVAPVAAAHLAPGTPIPALSRSYTQDQMSAFSWAGKGFANVHTSAEKAAASGLPRTIVQAQQQTGLIVENMVSFFGASWFTDGHLDLRFISPVFLEDQIRTTGAVIDERDGRLELEVWIDKNDGTRTAVGWASAPVSPLPDRPTPLLQTR